MTRSLVVAHFEQVDIPSIEARFSRDRRHRALLRLPFRDRKEGKTLCVVGQNPSRADEHVADKTIRYIEEFVYRRCPEFSQLLILNLFSRIDTTKTATDDIQDAECARIFDQEVAAHRYFLVIFGKLQNRGKYRFVERAKHLKVLLSGKTIYKLGIGTSYAPHPGNSKIIYYNFDLNLAPYDFSDL